MAVTQYSLIQHRRGDRADLPQQLNAAEIGWCTDTLEAFIGNGSIGLGTDSWTTYTVDISTNIFTVASHGFNTGNIVQFRASTTQPTPLTNGTAYFVVVLTANTFKVSTTVENAYNDITIDITVAGAGTLEVRSATGNSQFLTDGSDNFDILKYTFVGNTATPAVTGPTANDPIQRTLQEVLDDRISIKAYGALGDGSQDDSTSINRAMVNVYTVASSEPYRRIVYFPAGTYRLSAATMKIPTNAILMGDGVDKTIIYMDSNVQLSVFETMDSAGNTGLNIGNAGATMPTNILVGDMTFKHNFNQNVAALNRTSDSTFFRTKFQGASSAAAAFQAIVLDPLGAVYTPKNIKFTECEFNTNPYVANFNAGANIISNIVFDKCKFDTANYGVVGANTNYVTVQNSHFKSITNHGMHATSTTTAWSSRGNYYETVGSVGTFAAINFAGANGVSHDDKFNLTGGVTKITNTSTTTQVIHPTLNFTWGLINETQLLGPLTILAGQTNAATGISIPYATYNAIKIEYTLHRNTDIRMGTLLLAATGAVAAVTDSNAETAAIGVTFDAVISGANIIVRYTSTAGNPATMLYTYRSWLA